MIAAPLLGLAPLALAPLGQEAELPRLTAGDVVVGELTEADEVESSPFQPRVRAFALAVEAGGPHALELHSLAFDANLRLMDEGGAILAGTGSGWYGDHARLVTELEAGREYRLLVGSLYAEVGPFELALRVGEPAPLEREQLFAALEADVQAARATFGASHPITASNLAVLARSRFEAGDRRNAREPAEQAFALLSEDLGLGAARTQKAVHTLVSILIDARAIAPARELLERALEAAQETLGPGHPMLLETMQELAVTLYYQDELSEGAALAEEVAQLSEEALGPLHRRTLQSYQLVADLLDPLGEFERAREIYLELAPQMEEVCGPRSKALANLLHNHAFMEVRLAEYGHARELYERVLDIRLELLGEEHPETISTRGALGDLLRKQEDLAGARDMLERALESARRTFPPEHPRIGYPLTALAWVRIDEGSWEEAAALIDEALAIHEATDGPDSLRVAACLTQLASALNGMGGASLERAREVLERALATRVARLGRDDLSTAHTLATLATIHWKLYEVDAAAAVCGEALEVFESKLGPDAAPTLQMRHLMGNILWRGRGPEAAIPLFQEVLERRGAGGSREVSRNRSTTQAMLGAALLQIGDEAEALQLTREAFREAWTYLVTQSGGMTEEELFAALATQREKLQILLELPARADSPEALRVAYEAQLAWKGLVARLVHDARERVHAAPTPERAAALEELASVQGELSNLFLGDAGGLDRSSERSALEDRRRALTRELETGSDSSLRWVAWTELRDALPPGTATLDILTAQPLLSSPAAGDPHSAGMQWGAPHLLAWIVRAEAEAPLLVELGPAAPLEGALRDALAGLRPSAGADRGVPAASAASAGDARALQRSSELLWAPVQPHLGGVERIIVSPDSFVCSLPFEVLVDSAEQHLIERFAFSYSHDLAGDLGQRGAGAERERAPTLLVAGGVDFDAREGAAASSAPTTESATALRGRAGSSWAPLPGTAREAEAITGLHEELFGAQVARTELTGARATEESISAGLTQHEVVHLATHGFFLGTDFRERLVDEEQAVSTDPLPGLLNGLVCAGANTPPADGRADGCLTAEELAWLDLSGVELVVLSACDTAQGVSRSGEGLIGLRRAFRGAGARHVVSSLWPVEDRATVELMRAFYARLWRDGDSAAVALRAAQLGMLARNRAEQGDARPATWGAFVISGDWR